MATISSSEEGLSELAPGTVGLQKPGEHVVLQPQPSDDINEPLNWSKTRKIVNFGLACYFCLVSFVLVDIGPVVWNPLMMELGFTIGELNNSFAACLAGLGIGCFLLIPLAYRYGRRPVYILSIIIQIAGCVWQAETKTVGDIMGSNVICGFGAAVTECLVQLTIFDLFFVHQRGLANGVFVICQSIGAFLSLPPAGVIAQNQGWRWMWWWNCILLAIALVAFVFFYEETKYTHRLVGSGHQQVNHSPESLDERTPKDNSVLKHTVHANSLNSEPSPSFSMKSIRERLAFVTPTNTPIISQIILPFKVLFFFLAVAYSSLLYGSLLSWYSIVASVQSTYFLYGPYNFNTVGIGLLNVAIFIGCFIGAILGGPLNDRCILFLSWRNNGIYEPEMRLWGILLGLIICPAGILVFGLTLDQGMAWIVPCVGSAIFGVGFGVQSDVILSYVMDCYEELTGILLVSVTFVRNALSMVFVFALTPWLEQLGLRKVVIVVACLSIAFTGLTLPMIIFGKRARIYTAARYREFALN